MMSLFCPYCNSEAVMQGQTTPGRTVGVDTEFLCADCEKLSQLDGENPARVLTRHPKEKE